MVYGGSGTQRTGHSTVNPCDGTQYYGGHLHQDSALMEEFKVENQSSGTRRQRAGEASRDSYSE